MKLSISKEDDALYLKLDETLIVESEEVQPGIIFDYDDKGQVIGIEMLGLSNRISMDEIKNVQLETI